MSIEREQDDAVPVPGTPAEPPAAPPTIRQDASHGLPIQTNIDSPLPDHGEPSVGNQPVKSTAGEARSTASKRRTKKVDASAIDQVEKKARHTQPEDPPQPALLNEGALAETVPVGSAQTHKTSPRTPRQQATNSGPTAALGGTPRSKRQSAAKETAANNENIDRPDEQPTTSSKPKKRQGKTASSKALGTEQESAGRPLGPKASASMPSITNEAIAFLGNPAAGSSDLFKLSEDSQAFIRYHITNMERREIQGALDHAYLLATAPKYSVQFEKAADALVSKLVRERPTLVEATNTKTEPNSPTPPSLRKAVPYFGLGQPTVTVSLSKRIPDSSVGQRPAAADENSIEPSKRAEKSRVSVESPEHASPNQVNQSRASGPIAMEGSHRFLRGMTTAFQMAANWLENRERGKEKPAGGEASRLTEATQDSQVIDRSTAVPEDVARRFLKVERDYYFLDRTPAFSDRGDKLATRGEHPEVIRSLMDIAIARGWDNITVKGTESFRRAAWLEASQSGVKVAGYTPTALDLADLAGRPAQNAIQKNASKDRPNVPHQADNAPDVEDSKRTAKEQEKTGSRTTSTSEMASPELIAKAQTFEKEKPSFVIKKHPELAPAYGVIDAAKKFAESNLPEEAKEEFVGLARQHVINKIMSGDAVVGPKVYSAPSKAKHVANGSVPKDEKLATLIERSRTKGIGREK